MLGAVGIRGDIRQVDLCFHQAGKLDLGLFGCFTQPLQGLFILAQVNTVILPELVCRPVNNPLVPVVATQVGIAIGGFHFHNTFSHIKDRYIESTAAQVEYKDALICLLIQAVRQGRGSRLVDDTQHFKPGDLAGILGGLPLAIVEIGRHGDDRLRDRFAQVGFSIRFQLAQHHG